MNIVSTSVFRKDLGNYVDMLTMGKSKGFVIGRYDQPEAVVVPFPKQFRNDLSDSTNVAIYGGAFDFLKDEPDIYSVKDTLEWKSRNKVKTK